MSKESNLKALANMAENIKGLAEMLIEDIDVVTEMDDLFTIESKFDQIMSTAKDGYYKTRETYDLFEEEGE